MLFTKELTFEYKKDFQANTQEDESCVITGTLVSKNADGHQIASVQAKVVRPAGNDTGHEAYFLEHLTDDGFTAVVE